MAEADPFESGHLVGHVKDADYFEVPRFFAGIDPFGLVKVEHGAGHLEIPQPFQFSEPVQLSIGFAPLDQLIEPLEGRVTKFMVLEIIGALIVAVIFIWVAGRLKSGDRPRGRLWNLFEAMLVFLRDEVARPAIGRHDADRFLPFIWTIFFFVLICNLLGMVPWAGSPTGAIATTATMAFVTFATVVGAGMAKLGVIGFWTAQVPNIDLPIYMAVVLKPMIFAIEVLGLCIKHFVLAVRLLANMMAGHIVLAVVITFVLASVKVGLLGWLGISVVSLLGATALSMLELFVAFLQAYIFAFLSALFIGMAVHPH